LFLDGEFMSSIYTQIEEISHGILTTIEQSKMKDLSSDSEVTKILHLIDVNHAKKLVENLDKVSTKAQRNVGKIAVIKALLLSTWLQRLYFVIRSTIMGILSSIMYLVFILILGSINFFSGIALGIFSFAFSLVISRLFDKQIVRITKGIVTILGKHQRLRDLVINHL
jgi:hypothetical protein